MVVAPVVVAPVVAGNLLNMNKEFDQQYLSKVDPILAKVISTQKITRPKKVDNFFLDLVETIIGQQLSVKAARTITGRFFELFPNKAQITPEQILQIDKEILRS